MLLEAYANFSTGFLVDSLEASDINNDGQNEILAASNSDVYVLNSTCGLIWNYDTGAYVVNSLYSGDLTADDGEEIVLGTKSGSNGNYYLLNSTGGLLWNRTHSDAISYVIVGEFDNLNSGLEIVGGTENFKVHLLDSAGNIYWDYSTGSGTQVSALAIGNLSEDTGNNANEIVIGTKAPSAQTTSRYSTSTASRQTRPLTSALTAW